MKILGIIASRSFPTECKNCKRLTDRYVEHCMFHSSANYQLFNNVTIAWSETIGLGQFLENIHLGPYEQCIQILKYATEVDLESCRFVHMSLVWSIYKMFK